MYISDRIVHHLSVHFTPKEKKMSEF